MKKSSQLYLFMLAAWGGLIAVASWPLLYVIQRSEQFGWFVITLVTMSTLFILYFWLNGIKDVVYTLSFYARRRRFTLPAEGLWRARHGNMANKKIVAVYCTYNDFNAASLAASLVQDYPGVTYVILDDSTDPTYMQEVDTFATAQGIEVVRREDRSGFKAGNLNNYLANADYDYFIILDSDEIIPTNFVTRCLDYFAMYPNAGIVQANHIATRNRNKFMHLFSIGVDSHWPTYQTMKHYYGFLSLLGHGAMVSRECYLAAGGFPHLVAEDLCMSIEARSKGYFVAFAPDIMCEEEYPISYLAFKKRHSKWTQGNMEFIKKYTWRIFRSKLTWYEKLDIILFTYSLPLTAFFALYIVINVVLLPVLDYRIAYPVWMIIPTIIFLLAPMLNDIFFYSHKIKRTRLAWYLFHTILLYGSMLFTSLRASLTSAFGRSIFLVTPKNHSHTSKREAMRANRGEIMFGSGMLGLAYVFNHTVLSTLIISIPALLSVYLAMMANKSTGS